MLTTDKEKIIKAIQQTDDERIWFAIKRLLLIEEDEISEWQKKELDKRNEHIDSVAEEVCDWDDIKEEITKIDW